jgi:hypothetical protein
VPLQLSDRSGRRSARAVPVIPPQAGPPMMGRKLQLVERRREGEDEELLTPAGRPATMCAASSDRWKSAAL